MALSLRATNLALMESGQEKQLPQIKFFLMVYLSVTPLK